MILCWKSKRQPKINKCRSNWENWNTWVSLMSCKQYNSLSSVKTFCRSRKSRESRHLPRILVTSMICPPSRRPPLHILMLRYRLIDVSCKNILMAISFTVCKNNSVTGLSVCLCSTVCEHDVLQITWEFHQIYNWGAVEDKDKLDWICVLCKCCNNNNKEDTREVVVLFQYLSIALQRGSAIAFLATFNAMWYPVVVIVFA